MIGEFGEYANSLKHMFGGGTNQTKVDNVQPTQLLEELADMWIYLVLTVENLGFDELQFNSAISRKVKRLYERMNERKHEDKMR
jgi:NTP pyrophosphatase (non-canonical NTP hydrolase)